MNYDQTSLIRQLIPTSFSFDIYEPINYPNFREKRFFSDNVIPIGTHYLSTKIVKNNLLKIEFSSVCPKSEIQIMPYYLTLEEYTSKLITAKKRNSGCISLNIKIQICCNRRIHKCKLESIDCIKLRKSHIKISNAKIFFDISELTKALKIIEE